MFISNNRTSFHLSWKENLVKHRKFSKYYETDCGYKNNLPKASNRWPNNKIYTKNKLQFSYFLSSVASSFCKNCQSVKALPITARRKSEEKLPTTEATQGNLRLPLSPNFPDLHQNKKMKSCTDPAAPFPCVPGTKTIRFWKNPRDISLPWNYASVLKFYSCHPE